MRGKSQRRKKIGIIFPITAAVKMNEVGTSGYFVRKKGMEPRSSVTGIMAERAMARKREGDIGEGGEGFVGFVGYVGFVGGRVLRVLRDVRVLREGLSSFAPSTELRRDR